MIYPELMAYEVKWRYQNQLGEADRIRQVQRLKRGKAKRISAKPKRVWRLSFYKRRSISANPAPLE